MFYKLTLLKDLPEYKAGTIFSYWKGRMYGWCNSMVIERFMGKYGKSLLHGMRISEKLLHKPEWIKMEVDFSKLTDIACPKCGGTHFDIFKYAYQKRNSEGGYDAVAEVYLECPCGYERIL